MIQAFFSEFWSNYLRSNEIYAKFGEISVGFEERSHQMRWDLHQIWWIFTWKKQFWHFFSIIGNSTRTDHFMMPIWLSRLSTAGLNFHHPILSSRSRVGHKLDPDQPMDTLKLDIGDQSHLENPWSMAMPNAHTLPSVYTSHTLISNFSPRNIQMSLWGLKHQNLASRDIL